MAHVEDEFFFEVDPEDEFEDIPSNAPREIVPDETPKKDKRERNVNISRTNRRDSDPSLLPKAKLERLYNRVSPFLSPEQKRYTKKIINGTGTVDTRYEMELLVRQMGLLFSEAWEVFFDEKRVTRDMAAFADSLRQSIKDLREIEREDREDADQDRSIAALGMAEQEKKRKRLEELLKINGDG